MSETEQDDAKRRQRARFVEALTSTARQPGERSRLGMRVAGATAVLALVAGGTLGLGAWRSYQADENAKSEKVAAEQAAALRKIAASRSASRTSANPKSKPKQKPKEAGQPARRADAPVIVPAAPPVSSAKQQSKPKTKKKKKDLSPLVVSDRSGLLLKNAASGFCADLSDTQTGQWQNPIITSHCDGTDGDNQQWTMQVHRGDTGRDGASLVLFVNAKTGMCLDVPDLVAQPAGTRVQEANCHSTVEDNELWWLDPVGDGSVRIRNYMSNSLCLALWGDGQKYSSIVWIDSCDADRDSAWRLID